MTQNSRVVKFAFLASLKSRYEPNKGGYRQDKASGGKTSDCVTCIECEPIWTLIENGEVYVIFPDFSPGQAERPAVRRSQRAVRAITGGSPDPLTKQQKG